jgi:hypothetical protein
MTLDAIKQFFRRHITVIAGGPTDLTRGTDELAVLDALADVALGSPNDRPSYRKAVSYYSANTPGYAAGRLTLSGLDPEFCALHTQCVVEFGPDGYTRTYELRYDAQGPVMVYREFGGSKLPASWVLTDAPQASVPSYSYLQAISGVGGYAFKVDELVRDYAGTNTEYFFAAKVAGALTAPSSPIGDANWRRVSPDEVPQPGPRVAPNTTRGADKRVRFRTNAQLAASGGVGAGDSLEGIANDSLCLGQLAWVEFYGPNKYGITLRLMYDGDPRPTPDPSGVYAYRTGHCEPGDVLPAKWVEPTVEESGVPTYTQLQQSAGVGGYSFTVDELVRDFAGTYQEYFFAALSAGPLPAPSSPGGDANWRRLSPAEIPTPQISFFERITQATAIALDGDEAAYSGRRYAVQFPSGQYVEMVGTEARRFPTVGVLNGEEVLANIYNGYVETTGAEQLSWIDAYNRFTNSPPIPGKLYGIYNRPLGGAEVICRFDNITNWYSGGIYSGMLVAYGAQDLGQPGTVSYDFADDTSTPAGSGGSGPANTDYLPEGSANLYFTAARVLATNLAGYVKATYISALNNGQTLPAALGFLEYRIDVLNQALKVVLPGNTQSPVTVGGKGNNVSGLESAAVGGGGNTITGSDSATVGGYQISIFGNASAQLGGGYSQVHGAGAANVGGYGLFNKGNYSAIIGGNNHNLNPGADRSVLLGGSGFSSPALADMVFMPQAYIFRNGGGLSLPSPDGTKRKVLALDNDGDATLDGVKLAATGGAGPAPAHVAPVLVGQDDNADTLTVTPAANYRYTEVECSLDIASVTPTTVTLSMVQPNGDLVLDVGNFDRPAGSVGFRTRLGGGRAASPWVTNPAPYTRRAGSYQPSNGLTFNAPGFLSPQFFRFPVPASTDGITVTAWVYKIDAWAPDYQWLFTFRPYQEVYVTHTENSVSPMFIDGQSKTGLVRNELTPGLWHRIAFRVPASLTIAPYFATFFVNGNDGEPGLNIKLRDVIVWNRLLTDAELSDPNAAPAAGQWSRYDLISTQTDPTVADTTGNGHDGTLHGF